MDRKSTIEPEISKSQRKSSMVMGDKAFDSAYISVQNNDRAVQNNCRFVQNDVRFVQIVLELTGLKERLYKSDMTLYCSRSDLYSSRAIPSTWASFCTTPALVCRT
jgi:hypothetical protein